MSEELTKEKFGLLTGIFLTWAIIGLKLYEYVSKINFGSTIGLTTMNWPSEGTNTALWLYWGFTLLIGLSFSVTVLCILYILNMSLYFFVAEKKLNTDSILLRSSTLYSVIILCAILSLLSIIYILFAALTSSLCEHFLLGILVNAKTRGWTGRVVTLVIILIVFFFGRKKFFRYLRKLHKATSVRAYIMASFFTLCSWYFFIQQTFRIEVVTDNVIYEKSKKEFIKIDIKLGGATSNISDADVFIETLGKNKISVKDFMKVNDAEYFAYINSSSLDTGKYNLNLVYKHVNFSEEPPYLKPEIETISSFVIVD